MLDIEQLSSRVRILEARYRRIKILAMIAVVVVTTVAFLDQSPAQKGPVDRFLLTPDDAAEIGRTDQSLVQSEVRAQHFVLVDPKGKERASLVADAGGSVFLVMFDPEGKTRANLSVSSQGPSLVFYDPSGQPRTILGSTMLVASHVSENGVVERSPASSVVLFDRTGKILSRTP